MTAQVTGKRGDPLRRCWVRYHAAQRKTITPGAARARLAELRAQAAYPHSATAFPRADLDLSSGEWGVVIRSAAEHPAVQAMGAPYVNLRDLLGPDEERWYEAPADEPDGEMRPLIFFRDAEALWPPEEVEREVRGMYEAGVVEGVAIVRATIAGLCAVKAIDPRAAAALRAALRLVETTIGACPDSSEEESDD